MERYLYVTSTDTCQSVLDDNSRRSILLATALGLGWVSQMRHSSR